MIIKMSGAQPKWFRWISLLLIAAVCLTTPAHVTAAPPEPEANQLSAGTYMPFLSNNVCFGTRSTDNKVGVQLYGPSGYPEAHFKLLQNTHSHWIRNLIFWPSIEVHDVGPDSYRWGPVDRVARAANDNCANLILTIDGTPNWASDGGARVKPKSIPDLVEFVTALAERYDGDGFKDAPNGAIVNYWEIYNEPDFGLHDDGWGPFGDRYAQMLKEVYRSVKEANTNAQIVFGGIAANFYTDQGGNFTRGFLDSVLDAGGNERYFDYMSVHHYPFPRDRNNWTESNSSGLVEKLQDVRAKLDAHGMQDIPIMVTEVGWHTGGINDLLPSNPDWQARHVVQLLTQALASGSPAVIWWAFFDIDDFPYATGLVEAVSGTLVPKLSYAVYNEAIERLGPSKFERVVSRADKGNDLEIYEFSDPATGHIFYVAWLNPIAPFNKEALPSFDDSVTQQWQAPHSRVNIYGKDGVLLRTVNDGDDGNNDGNVTITVPRSPIYIVVE